MAEQDQAAGQVSLEDLSPEQLQSVQQQLEDELKHLTSAFGNLKAAQTKFQACIEAIDAVKPANKDKKILIPLTSSLYVPGKLKDADNVLVDVGTGYFVEKPAKAAKTLYNGKILALKSNFQMLEEQIQRKSDNQRAVVEERNRRTRIAQQQQQQQQSKAGGTKA